VTDGHTRRARVVRAAARAQETPVRGYGLAPDGTPVVFADLSRRPDAADLARVLALEGNGDVRSVWHTLTYADGSGVAVVSLRSLRPVRCRFRLAFDLVRDRAILGRIAAAGGMLVTPAPVGTARCGGVYCEFDAAGAREIASLVRGE
jgi:hypothetical protein